MVNTETHTRRREERRREERRREERRREANKGKKGQQNYVGRWSRVAGRCESVPRLVGARRPCRSDNCIMHRMYTGGPYVHGSPYVHGGTVCARGQRMCAKKKVVCVRNNEKKERKRKQGKKEREKERETERETEREREERITGVLCCGRPRTVPPFVAPSPPQPVPFPTPHPLPIHVYTH